MKESAQALLRSAVADRKRSRSAKRLVTR